MVDEKSKKNATTEPSWTALEPREARKRRRERVLILLLALFFILLTAVEFRLTRVSNTLPLVNSIFFFGLLNINLIILMALVWLVFRNIGKVFLERRRRVLGSRLKTKLVVAFLAFSLVPTILLFIISALYINTSFDKWFSLKVQNTLQSSLEIGRVFFRNAEEQSFRFGEHLVQGVRQRADSIRSITPFLDEQRNLLGLDAIEFYPDPLEERVLVRHPSRAGLPEFLPRIPVEVMSKAFAGEKLSIVQHLGPGDLIRCLVPLAPAGANRGVIVVNTFVPVSVVNKVDEISNVIDDYRDVNPLRYPIKSTYLVILVMITLVIIFVAIWLGLYLARQLTVPLEHLVQGAQEVGAGNLDVSVNMVGHDEIATLIQSFNRMTQDLRESRQRLLETGADLERRRRQLETVLSSIGTGVLVVDESGKVLQLNRAAAQLLEVDSEQLIGMAPAELLREKHGVLVDVIDRGLEHGPTPLVLPGRESPSGDRLAMNDETVGTLPWMDQWNFKSDRDESQRTLAAISTQLPDAEGAGGLVVVIEDLTPILKVQRETAWREVARRIAHEIKNPLTPIKLSAQRLQRRLGGIQGREGELLQECTETIIRHTDELKEMVNEFSNFARLPQVTPSPNDLNAAIREVITLYEQAHPGIDFRFKSDNRLPVFDFDRDQVKRVIINLLDNAVAAISELQHDGGPRGTIEIETDYEDELKIARLRIRDDGQGMAEEVRERIFEPYFSTKKEGTGLGLAIVKRIVNDHHGVIRAESEAGRGTQFLVELPTSIWQGLSRS
jgi:two-component system nitrogen regulation sensor histidine kinase NtrY